MPEDKPIHVRRERYPEPIYPPEITAAEVTPRYPEPTEEEAVHLRDYWNVLVARRWTIVAIVLTIVSITMISTFRQVPAYRAETTLQIDRENPNILTFKDVYEIESLTDDTLQTQYKILSARTLARRVVEELKLDQSPEFLPSPPSIVKSAVQSLRDLLPKPSPKTQELAADEPDPLRGTIDSYLGRLTVSPVARSRLVKVSFEAEDPELAARVINEHSKQFIEQNLQFKFDATQQASDFLSQQLIGLKATLEKSEDKLQEYGRQNQILFTEEGRNTASEKLQQLEEEFIRAQSDRIQKEAIDRQVIAGNTNALPQLVNNSLIAQLSSQAAELRRQESNLSVSFQPDYPGRKRIRSQIEGIERDIALERSHIVQTVQTEYAASLERERLLTSELDKQRVLVNRINQDIIQYNILKREVDSNKQLYDGLLTRLKEAGISAGLKASNIRVVDRADTPRVPVKPQKGLNFLLSLAAGLVLAVGFAFFQEYLDNTFKSPDDISKTLQIPTLAIIPALSSTMDNRRYRYGYSYGGYGHKAIASSPKEASADGKPQSEVRNIPIELIIHQAPTSLLAEAYRSLRTSLLLSSADHPPRTVLVTSSVPSEGKTTTALNLATSLTQTGSRTLIIDADMRKPRVHKVFGLEAVSGLSSFLSGAASLREVIHETPIPNLFVLPCGMIPPNPGELILSNRFNRMVNALREYFEYVVIDSPPVTNVSDARVLANSCDAVVLVVKASATSRQTVKRALGYLSDSRTRTTGAVLNDLDARAKRGDYSYYKNAGYYGSPYSHS